MDEGIQEGINNRGRTSVRENVIVFWLPLIGRAHVRGTGARLPELCECTADHRPVCVRGTAPMFVYGVGWLVGWLLNVPATG